MKGYFQTLTRANSCHRERIASFVLALGRANARTTKTATSFARILISALCTLGLLLVNQSPALAQSIAIAPIGDSITNGGRSRPSYRRALWNKLQQAGYNVDFVGSQNTFFDSGPPLSERDFDLDHEGHWGIEAGEIANSIDNWLSSYTPDIAIIHLGTNDFRKGQSNASTLVELGNIFSSLRADNPLVKILIAEIIPMRNMDTASLNTSIREWAPTQSTSASPVIVVDQYTGYNATADNYDNYHPNAVGEEKMAARWFTALQSVLILSENTAPIVDLDTDKTIILPSNSVDISVSVTDDGLPEGSTVGTQWTQTGGPTITLPVAPTTGGTFSTFSFATAGNYEFELTATDGELSSSDVIAITVIEPNDAPTAQPDSITLAASDASVLVNVLSNDTDPEDNALSIVLSSSATSEGGSVVVEDNQVRYSPPSSLERDDTFSYSARDSEGNLSNSATVTLILPDTPTGTTDGMTPGSGSDTDGGTTPENTLPNVQADSHIINDPSASTLIDVLANDNDPDGDTLTIVLDSNLSGQGSNLTIEDNQVRYTPTSILLETDFFTYHVRDSRNAESDSVTVTVIPSDQDGDGIVDSQDNCLVLSNSPQTDSDSDGQGDVCDVTPTGPGSTSGDGVPMASGQTLVEQECLLCHLDRTLGAPLFGDEQVWDDRIQAAGGDPANMVVSVQNGIGTMPAFGDRFSASVLLQAVLYLSGRENPTSVENPGPGIEAGESDLDLDAVADAIDNCPTVPNPDQADLNGDGVGNVCERLADGDNDGYPFSLDDDDSNAYRILASIPVTNTTVFSSESELSLGPVALAIAEQLDFASAAVVINETDFVLTANDIFDGAQVVSDVSISSLMGIADLSVTTNPAGRVDVIVQLDSFLPLNPALRLYNPSQSDWLNFDSSGTDSVSSSPTGSIGCPAAGSSNYQPGLTAGNQCVKVTATDGGSNDWDAQANGTVPLMMNFGNVANLSDDDSGVDDINTNPERVSSGGTFALPILLLLAAMVGVRLRRKCYVLHL